MSNMGNYGLIILTKSCEEKNMKFWERREQFPYGDSVSKARKGIKLSGIKASTI